MSSSRVRLIMMIVAVSFAAGMFGVLALRSSVHDEQLGQNLRMTVPALGPKAARPAAYDLRWQTRKTWQSISDLKGKVIYINFWASWCEPCKAELPIIEKLQKKLGTEKFQVLLINMDDNPKALLVAQKMQMELVPSAATIYEGDKQMRELFNIEALPFHMVIDKEGHTAAAFYARIDKYEKDFDELLRDLINEP